MKTIIWLILPVIMMSYFTAETPENKGWKELYQDFVEKDTYLDFILAGNPANTELMYERDKDGDGIALYDLDQDKIPELLIRSWYHGFDIEQIDVFSCKEGKIRKEGTMGGEVFFDLIFSLEKAGISDRLYTFSGGAYMGLDEYWIGKGGLVRGDAGVTRMDSNEEHEWIEIWDSYGCSKERLEELINAYLSGSKENITEINWYGKKELQDCFDEWDRRGT